MPTSAIPNFREHLKALGDKYAASVPERMQAIAAALAAAGNAPDAATLEAVHHALHTVAGSAGSFGFTVLGNEARRLEQLVRGVMAGGDGWSTLAREIERYMAWALADPRSSTFPSHD